MTTRRAHLPLALACAVAVACGSTVPLDGGQVAAGPGAPVPGVAMPDDGLGVPGSPGTAPPTSVGTAPTTRAPTTRTPTTSPPTQAPATQPPPPQAPGPASTVVPTEPGAPSQDGPSEPFPVAAGTPGITDDEIHIGFAYAENANAGNEAVGFDEVTRGDARRYHDLWVERINASGGIAGRQLVPVYHVLNGASNESLAAQEEQICATWTQDNEVFTATIAAASDVLRQCLANADVGLISGQGLGVSDDQTFRDFPDGIEPNNLSLDPMARVTVDGLAAQGYFDAPDPLEPTRLGIITYDYPTFRRVTQGQLLPSLAAHGVEHEDPVYVRFPERQSDIGEVSAQLANTVLRFRSAGVTHVMIFEYNAALTALFLNSAESQAYRPRYGLNSQNGGQLMAELVPAAQLRGAVSVGWIPLFDAVDAEQNAAARSCEKIYDDAGITFDSANAKAVGMNFCDTYRLLKAGIEAAPGPLSRQTLTAGLERLGDSFESAIVQSVRLGPDRHYGVSSYRFSTFHDDCACFRYTGAAHPIP